jgi:O-antigen biosynthesis protein WbqP
MKKDAPDIATHLVKDGTSLYTSIGPFLRKFSLDELPQLMNILKGDMTFIGPRPALYNQDDLIDLRSKAGVHHLKPGVTGWAQVNGRDELSIPDKVKMDEYYLKNKSLWLDIKILFLTLLKVFKAEGVKK